MWKCENFANSNFIVASIFPSCGVAASLKTIGVKRPALSRGAGAAVAPAKVGAKVGGVVFFYFFGGFCENSEG